MNRLVIGVCMAQLISGAATAAVKSKTIEYKVGDLPCRGYLAWDDSIDAKRPGVLVVHEWWGLNDYARQRANELASLGCVAFACDMYGEGKVVEHPQDAGKMAATVRSNVAEWRKRATVALEQLKAQPQCDGEHLAAIGYCFGGSTALELAYSGADLDAVATFHAALPIPTADEAKQIKASVQINHGAMDTFIPEDDVKKLRAALDTAKVDWELSMYGNTVHSFTVKGSEKHMIPGMAYNAEADQRSWANMVRLFEEKGVIAAKKQVK